MEWRPYQLETIEAVIKSWQTHNRIMAVAATGAGKTQLMWGITDFILYQKPDARVLVLAHRRELIEQPKQRVKDFFPHLLSKVGVVMGQGHTDCHKQIVIATVQTLGNKSGSRIKELLNYGAIDLLIVDECHHFTKAGIYNNVLEALTTANPELKVLGVTATPERADKKDLTAVFEHEAANVGVARLIDEEWLCRPEFIGVLTDVDLSDVPVGGSGAARDYNPVKLAAAFETKDVFKIVVDTHMDKCGDRPTIAFLPSVHGAYHLAELLQAKGIKAIAADGNTPTLERDKILEDFKAGRLTCLVNCGLYGEGLDLPQLENLHIVRPTKSDSLYLQFVGRILRKMDGKLGARVYDYQPKGYRNFDQRLKKLGLRPKTNEPGEGGGERQPKKKLKAKGEIQYTVLDYFKNSKEAWAEGKDGWRVISFGRGADNTDRGMAVPPDGTQLWVVWRKENDSFSKAKLFLEGTFEEVKAKTEEYIRQYGNRNLSHTNARWRMGVPTQKAEALGRNLRVYKEGMTAGELSDLISARLTLQAVGRERSRMQKEAEAIAAQRANLERTLKQASEVEHTLPDEQLELEFA